MATRHSARRAAQRRSPSAHHDRHNKLHRRTLRYEPLEDRRLLAVLTIDTLADEVNLNDDFTSLREAIVATNLADGADTIDFAPSLFNAGPGLILLRQGELRITDHLTIEGPGAYLLTIDASGNDPTPTINNGSGTRVFTITSSNVVSIRGLTLTGGDSAQRGGAIFNKVARLTLKDTVITGNAAREYAGGVYASNGTLEIDSSTISNNIATGPSDLRTGGGGLFMGSGNLTIRNSTISGNVAPRGGGLFFRSYSSQQQPREIAIVNSMVSGNKAFDNGGGIWATMSGGSMTIVDTLIEDNVGGHLQQFAGHGGGMWAELTNVTATISGSVVRDNNALSAGGAWIRSEGGNLKILDTSVSGNGAFGSAASGGGLFMTGRSGTVTIRNSIVDGNSSALTGGGLYVDGVGLSIENSTVSGNSANIRGGGIFHRSGMLHITHSTLTENVVGNQIGGGGLYTETRAPFDLLVEHSIIAGNQIQFSAPADLARSPGNGSLIVRYSLIGSNERSGLAETPPGVADANGNIIGGKLHGVVDPMLGPLADNGGPTLPGGSVLLTHALLPGSPAINAGDLNVKAGEGGVPLYDQRGEPFARVVNGRIDIGAFEYGEPSDLNLLVDTLEDESDGNYARGDLSLREAIEIGNMWPSVDTIRFDPALTATGPAAILLTMGELRITDDVSIDGPGAKLMTIDASGNDATPDINDGQGSRVFNIDDGSPNTCIDVSISELTITGADVSSAGGGAIRATDANLVISSSAILDNAAASGAAVGMTRSTGTITQSTVFRNATLRSSGAPTDSSAVDAFQTALAITGTTISENEGAGVRSWEAAGTQIVDSTITNNDSGIWILSIGYGTSITETIVSGHRYGGMYIATQYGPRTTISNATITNNSNNSSIGPRATGGLTVIGSEVMIANSLISGNIGRGGGGAYLDVDKVMISHCTISHNQSNSGGGIFVLAATSGEIRDSEIFNNSASHHGGGVYAAFAIISLRRCKISGNTALDGAGAYVYGGTTIDECTITENSATNSGGGVSLVLSNAKIVGSTIANNSSGRKGGGVFGLKSSISDSTISGNTGGDRGGGIYTDGMSIIGSTISGNSAENGGGIFSSFDSHITHSTIVFNQAGSFGGGIFVESREFTLDHTIVAENTAPGTIGIDVAVLFGADFSARYSLIGRGEGSGLVRPPLGVPDANGNLVGEAAPFDRPVDPNLGPLADNGGPTLTHALLPGSPAINAGDPAAMAGVDGVPLFDQRGEPFMRVYGGRIDIGAFEWQPEPVGGDYNANGVVDAADFVVWRGSLGSTTNLAADGSGDGWVSEYDRRMWVNNFGRLLPGEQGAGSLERGMQHGAWSVEHGDRAESVPTGYQDTQALAPVSGPQPTALPDIRSGPRSAWRPPSKQLSVHDDLLSSLVSPRAIHLERDEFTPLKRSESNEVTDQAFALHMRAVDNAFDALGGQ